MPNGEYFKSLAFSKLTLISCNNFRKREKDGSGKILSETRTQGATGEVD